MKEVRLDRFAGPFAEIPYDYFLQSPIGLVNMQNGDTRLVFHLSYPTNHETIKSVNACTPEEVCTVHYKDLDNAIKMCFDAGKHWRI